MSDYEYMDLKAIEDALPEGWEEHIDEHFDNGGGSGIICERLALCVRILEEFLEEYGLLTVYDSDDDDDYDKEV